MSGDRRPTGRRGRPGEEPLAPPGSPSRRPAAAFLVLAFATVVVGGMAHPLLTVLFPGLDGRAPSTLALVAAGLFGLGITLGLALVRLFGPARRDVGRRRQL